MVAQEKPKFRFVPAEALRGAQKAELESMKDAYASELVPKQASDRWRGVREHFNDLGVVLVALSGENPIGFVAGRGIPDLKQLRIFAFYVKPEHRRQGLLERFIHRARAEARKRGLPEVRLVEMREPVLKRFTALAQKKGRRKGEFRAYGKEGIIKSRKCARSRAK